MPTVPAFIFPSDGTGTSFPIKLYGATYATPIAMQDNSGSNIGSSAANVDTLSTGLIGYASLSFQVGLNATTQQWQRQRFSDGLAKRAEALAIAAAGNLVVWTPAATKKFRVQSLVVSTDTAQTLAIKDGATVIYKLFVGANSVTTINLPVNGVLSATANNTLNMDYSATTGNISVTAVGNEE
jgi:hypothetical protein